MAGSYVESLEDRVERLEAEIVLHTRVAKAIRRSLNPEQKRLTKEIEDALAALDAKVGK